MLKHQLNKLESGLEVIRIPIDTLPSVTVLILGNTGSRYETPVEQGLAHFFEHMVFKGTKKFPSAKTISELIDGVGAESNAFTSKEFTGYYIKVKSDHIQLALDILSDMLLAPKLVESEIEKEKGVIIEEMNMYLDTPMRDIGNLFDQLVFVDQSIGHDVIGTKQTVSGMSKQNFINFLDKWYGLANLTLVLAGDARVLNQAHLLEGIDKLFTSKLAGADRVKKRVETEDLLGPAPLRRRRLIIRKQKTKQVHLMLGWPGIARNDKRYYAMSILANILGGNMSSRLFSEVREKRGLCYYVNSSPDYYHDAGTLTVAAGVDPQRVHEALSVIIDECQKLASGKEPLSEKEMTKAKENLVGNMALSFEDSMAVAQFFGLRQVLTQKIETPEEVMNQVRGVTLESVQALAKEIIRQPQLRLAVIGPFTESEFKRYVE